MAWADGMTPLSALYNTGLGGIGQRGYVVRAIQGISEYDYGPAALDVQGKRVTPSQHAGRQLSAWHEMNLLEWLLFRSTTPADQSDLAMGRNSKRPPRYPFAFRHRHGGTASAVPLPPTS
jgi:hypothetical protein